MAVPFCFLPTKIYRLCFPLFTEKQNKLCDNLLFRRNILPEGVGPALRIENWDA